MDLEHLAGIEPAVDEDAIQDEVEHYLGGVELHREPWKITNIGQADWAMRRVAECRALAERYDGEVLLWQAARGRIDGAVDWFEDRLKEWAIAERTPSVKTLRTAHGTVATRESKPKIAVVDEEAAIVWAKTARPEAVKMTERFLVSEIGDAASIGAVAVAWVATNKQTGEVERIEIAQHKQWTPERSQIIQDTMGDGYVVDVELQAAVIDVEGVEVPGLAVVDGKVTATVTPLGL